MTEVLSPGFKPSPDETIHYLYVADLEELQCTDKELVEESHVIVVGYQDVEHPKPRKFKKETARRTIRTGEAIGAIIGGSYTHEVTGASYNAGLLERVAGRTSRYLQVGTPGDMGENLI